MVKALVTAARGLREPVYGAAAVRATEFLLARMRDRSGRLLHRFREGEAAIPGQLDDYAFLADALVSVYEWSGDPRHLEAAIGLVRILLERFWDPRDGGFFITPDDGEALLVRQKEVYDGAVPSGNSVALIALLRLARLTGTTQLEEKAAAVGRAFAQTVGRAPSAHTQFLAGIDFALGPTEEIVIVGRAGAPDTAAMLNALQGPYLPAAVLIHRPANEDEPPIARLAPFVRALTARDGKATAYVCRNQACSMPTTDPAKMLETLGARRTAGR